MEREEPINVHESSGIKSQDILQSHNTRLKLLADERRIRKRRGSLIRRHLRQTSDYLQNPRYSRNPKSCKALQLHIWKDSNKGYSTLPEPPSILFNGYEIGSTYTTQLKVLNVSTWSQRLRILHPNTQYFHISSADPCLQGAVLAPGKSCKFSIVFMPNTKEKVEDFITVRCEMCAITLRLIAKNPFPWVELPSTVNIGPCLVGHRLPYLLSVLSRGAEGSYKVFTNDGLPSAPKHDVLKEHDFLVYPSQFRLRKDEAGDVLVLFVPSSPGKFILELKLATDCGAEWRTEIIGYGVKFDLSIEDMTGKQFGSSQDGIELWFGHATISSMKAHKKLLIKNPMPIPMHYHWRIEDNCSNLQSDGKTSPKTFKAAFVVSPNIGTIDAESDMLFMFTFSPHEVMSCRQQAALYIDTRRSYPLETDLWKQLKGIMEYPTSKLEYGIEDGDSKIQIEEFNGEKQDVGADNAGHIRKVAEFRLSGIGEPLQVELIPPLLHWPNIIQQGQSHTAVVTIKNNSCVKVFFSWSLLDIPHTKNANLNHFSIAPSEGQISPMDKMEVKVCVIARTIGRLQEKLICEIMGGPRLVLHVDGSIQGPRIQLSPSLLDFGTVQVGKDSSLELILTNTSLSPACFKLSAALIRQMIDHQDNIDLGEQSNYPKTILKNTSVGNSFHKSSLSRINCNISGDHGDVVVDERVLHQISHPELLLFPPEETVPPKSSVNVKVKYSPLHCGQYRWAITCEVAGGKAPAEYAIVNTLAAAPNVNISPSSFDCGIVYLGLTVQKTVCIQNLSMLPGHYQWSKEMVNDYSSLELDFQPQEGVLSPNGIQEISINLTPKNRGENKYTVLCNVLGMVNPLQLTFRLYVLDMFCSYYVDRFLHFHDMHHRITSIDRTRLPILDFGKRCGLGMTHCLRVTVQNETGISGRIRVSLAKYDVRPLLSPKQIVELTSMCLNWDMKTSGILDDIGQYSMYNFSNENGRAMVRQKLWSSTCAKGGQGLSVLLSSYEGDIEPWKSWHCEVFCFACMPGTYSDILHFKLGNNCSDIEIPLTIGLVGCPLSVNESHLTPEDFSQTEERKAMVLKWSAAPAGCPSTSRKFWVTNAACVPFELEWESKENILSTSELCVDVEFEVEDEQKVHVFMLGDPDYGPIQLKFEVEDCTFVCVNLKERCKPISCESPFKIEPSKQCIPSRGSALFTATFFSEDAGSFFLNLVGKTYANESLEPHLAMIKEKDMDPSHSANIMPDQIKPVDSLYVSLEATTFPPSLKTSADEKLEFYFVASSSHSQQSSNSHSVFLTNSYSHNICFSITLPQPFFVVKILRGLSLDITTSAFCCDSLLDIILPPSHVLMLEINFTPTEEMLCRCEDLKIEDDLLIRFSNGFHQTISLIGFIEFPKVIAYTKSIWFGAVLIGSSQTIPFTISNMQPVDAEWHLVVKKMPVSLATTTDWASVPVNGTIEEDTNDDSYFTFDTHEGLLKGSCEFEPNQQVVNIKFSPHEPRMYSQTIHIEVLKGRGFSVLLEGQGVEEVPCEPPPPEPPKKKQGRAKTPTKSK